MRDVTDALELRRGKMGEFICKVNAECKGDWGAHLFTNRFFNHDAYDGLVKAGKTDFLKIQTATTDTKYFYNHQATQPLLTNNT